MRNQSSHLLALLLSVTVHLGLVFALANGARTTAGQISPEQPTTAIMVELKAPGSVVKAESQSPLPGLPRQAESPPKAPEPALAVRGDSASDATDSLIAAPQTVGQMSHDEAPLLPFLMEAGPYYFQLHELTEHPVVVQDIARQKVEVLPDTSPPPARVRLLINEKGEVDQVVIDEASFSEQAQRFISDAFATVKFRPGKVGDLPVKSQLSIEVTLEQVVAVPVQGPVTVH